MPENISAHPECQQAVSSLRLDHKLLEKDVVQLNSVSERLTDAVNKIQEMNSNLCALIKIHAEKHEHHVKAAEALDDDIAMVDQKLESFEKTFNAPHVDTEEEKALKKTLKELERWKWMIIGGALALGFVFGHLSFDVVAKLLH